MHEAVGKPAPRSLLVLIVEDEAILAMDLELLFEDLGHVVAAVASSLADVQHLPDGMQLDLAFVDMQLAGGSNGLEVCAELISRWPGIKVVFVTGNTSKIPPDFAGGHGVIAKPFSRSGLILAIAYIRDGIQRPLLNERPPPEFVLSPALAREWCE